MLLGDIGMLINYARAILLYMVVLAVTRLMGKREISELQPFEFVISLMIANLATIPMSDANVPIVSGIVPIMGLLTMHILITIFNLKSTKFRDFFCGKPKVLIHHGIIDEKALEKERFTISELEEKMREKDIFDLSQIEYAVLETNGDVSILLKTGDQTVSKDDMQIQSEDKGMCYNLILDGKVIEENMKLLNKTDKWLKNKLKMDFDKILVATINEQGDLFYQIKEKYQ